MRHHYVPKFLLRRWAFINEVGQQRMPAYYWDQRRQSLRMFPAGFNQVCCGDGLLAFRSDHPLGKNAIETNFFQTIDTLGSAALTKLSMVPRELLTHQQRLNFVTFLLSLEARRPPLVGKIRDEGAQFLEDGFNDDVAIRTLIAERGLSKTASEVFEEMSRAPLSDHALLLVQAIATNEAVAEKVLKFRWGTYTLGDNDGTFVLGDRPLIRINATDDASVVWAIPLSPKRLFFATPNAQTEANLARSSPKRVRNLVNSDSAMQCDRYVFGVESTNLGWLERRLRMPGRRTGPEMMDKLVRSETT